MKTRSLRDEQRKYLRTRIAFSVKYQPMNENGKPEGKLLRGHTKNIASGGMLIKSRIKKDEKMPELIPDETKLKLLIGIPPGSIPIDLTATVRWLSKIPEPAFDTLFFGVEYDQIDSAQRRMIERYVNRLNKKPRVFLYFSLLIIAFLIVFTYFIFITR